MEIRTEVLLGSTFTQILLGSHNLLFVKFDFFQISLILKSVQNPKLSFCLIILHHCCLGAAVDHDQKVTEYGRTSTQMWGGGGVGAQASLGGDLDPRGGGGRRVDHPSPFHNVTPNMDDGTSIQVSVTSPVFGWKYYWRLYCNQFINICILFPNKNQVRFNIIIAYFISKNLIYLNFT